LFIAETSQIHHMLVVDKHIHHRSSMGFGTGIILGLGAGAAKQMHKIGRRSLKDMKTRKSLDPKECIAFEDTPVSPRGVVSCCIQWVYQECKQEKVEYVDNNKDHWDHWGYKPVGFDILAGAYKRWMRTAVVLVILANLKINVSRLCSSKIRQSGIWKD